MKVIGVFIFIFLLTIVQTFSLDMLLGLTFSEAISHLLNPFWVMESGELIMLLALFLLTIAQQIIFMRKNKANKQNNSR